MPDQRNRLSDCLDPDDSTAYSSSRNRPRVFRWLSGSPERRRASTCRLIAEGLGTGDIADTQNLTRETVRTYVKRILEKPGTKNRAQLVRLALTVNLPIDES